MVLVPLGYAICECPSASSGHSTHSVCGRRRSSKRRDHERISNLFEMSRVVEMAGLAPASRRTSHTYVLHAESILNTQHQVENGRVNPDVGVQAISNDETERLTIDPAEMTPADGLAGVGRADAPKGLSYGESKARLGKRLRECGANLADKCIGSCQISHEFHDIVRGRHDTYEVSTIDRRLNIPRPPPSRDRVMNGKCPMDGVEYTIKLRECQGPTAPRNLSFDP